GIANANLLRPLAALLKKQEAAIELQHIDNEHLQSNTAGKAMNLARKALQKEITDTVDLSIMPEWQIHGAQLSMMTQKVMYQGIRSLTFPTKRKARNAATTLLQPKAYEKNLERIHTSIKQFSDKVISDKDIWIRCTKSQNATKEQNVWTWKAIHSTFWIGRKWLHCEGYEERATCRNCGVIEDMEHILVRCSKPGQAETWELARQFLARKQIVLPQEMTMGLVLGSALINPRDSEKNEIPGATRLTEITLREATALIWHMRNTHVIQHDNDPTKMPTATEIQNQFFFRLNRRMQLDVTLMSKVKFGRKAIPKATVLETWQ
ncbi:hypothetical protein GYMLUDRAFT_146736, partial [Collybiopsis luxurians FD-317 M1]